MNNQYVNLEDGDFNEVVDFIFNYLSTAELQAEWYEEVGITKRFRDAFARNCIKLFNSPEFLLDKYTSEQIEKGFCFILGPEILIRMWLWNKKNNPELRREFILSMVNVFEKVFVRNSLEDSCFMWWDYLRGFSDDKDLQVMDWMFEALSQILEIDSFDCQISALHGLGHIEHPEKKHLIENFLRKHPNFAKKNYALAAIKGEIL